MKNSHRTLTLASTLLPALLAVSGCIGNTPTKQAEESKSTKQIADEAMNSKGKLTKEQINALIAANAKCTPDKM